HLPPIQKDPQIIPTNGVEDKSPAPCSGRARSGAFRRCTPHSKLGMVLIEFSTLLCHKRQLKGSKSEAIAPALQPAPADCLFAPPSAAPPTDPRPGRHSDPR